jgi:hypothetical protein
MMSQYIAYQPNSSFSPDLINSEFFLDDAQMRMCYSIAQIALNAFILGSPEEFGLEAVSKAKLIWLSPALRSLQLFPKDNAFRRWLAASLRDREVLAVDSAFWRWAEARGEPLRGFLSDVREACAPVPAKGSLPDGVSILPQDCRSHLERVLRCMLE